jgi:hypothetical protein
VIVGGVVTMLQVEVEVPAEFPRESTTWAVKLKVPALVGVPLMLPLEVLRVRPGGSEPAVIEKV